ncbi:MAG TPA: hypothetical protein VFL68_02565 [Pseudolabrys sp.]|nr:hypothetical protein [Pseudolabrys sp.]
MFFQQMCDGEPSAKRGAVTVIESKKFIGRSVAEQVFQPLPKIASSPGYFEPVAFESKKCDFIERINHAEPGVEFEAVDDSDLVVQPDMLRPQIAVAVHDPAVAQSRDNLLTARLQKTALNCVDLAHQAAGNSKPRIKQDTLVVVEASCPIGQMDGGRQINRRRRAVEKGQSLYQAIKLGRSETPGFYHVVEHEAFVQPLHMHEPVDGYAITADRQLVASLRKRHDPEIHIGRQPPIQL